ncbi:MAG TPA: hypothetical protein VFI62_12220, partial [Burkholderiales bacterium]|nr:hypothetical protein [Burkholderiales bacterium]
MIRLGLRARLFAGALAMILISIASAELYLAKALESQLTERIRTELLIRAGLVARRVAATMPRLATAEAGAVASEQATLAGARVTLVRLDGSVAADSEVDATRLADLENHGARPEIMQALAQG